MLGQLVRRTHNRCSATIGNAKRIGAPAGARCCCGYRPLCVGLVVAAVLHVAPLTPPIYSLWANRVLEETADDAPAAARVDMTVPLPDAPPRAARLPTPLRFPLSSRGDY